MTKSDPTTTAQVDLESAQANIEAVLSLVDPANKIALLSAYRNVGALIAEVRAHREREAGEWIAKAYPGFRPPAAEARLVVAPSGFIEGVYAGQLVSEGWRIVRYVLAPPAVKEPR